jgi:hypothetical protein
MNFATVAGLPSRSITAVWYRAVDPRYLPTALGYSHTRLFASRYYEGPTAGTQFEIVYVAENPLVALFEVEALFGSPLIPGGLIPNPPRSWLTINAQVQLTRVADLPMWVPTQPYRPQHKSLRETGRATGSAVLTPVFLPQ